MKTLMLSFIVIAFAFTSVANNTSNVPESPSCSCKQVKKEGCRQNACTYTFDCKMDDGSTKKVTVASSNDNQAKQLAELECE